MGHNYQPDFDKMIQGKSIEASDAEIMSEIRKVMMAETVEHPEVAATPKRRPTPVQQTAAQKISPAIKVARKAKGYQPRWSHNLMILSLALIIYSPIGVVSVIALLVAAALAVYWCVGATRLNAAGRAVFGLYSRVFPAQSDRFVGWANRLSDRMQGLLNRMPASWTQGLYLPSFSTEKDAEMDLVEPFDRILAQRQGGVQTTVK